MYETIEVTFNKRGEPSLSHTTGATSPFPAGVRLEYSSQVSKQALLAALTDIRRMIKEQ